MQRHLGALISDIKNLRGQGPSAFEALVANEALARAGASKKQQIANIQADAARDLLRGNAGVQRSVAEALGDTSAASPKYGYQVDPSMTAEGILKTLQGNLGEQQAGNYASAYAKEVAQNPPLNSWRTPYQAVNQAIASNPKTAIAVGSGAASAGGVALITASGAALDDLSNFLAGGQQNQDTRDNVLRS